MAMVFCGLLLALVIRAGAQQASDGGPDGNPIRAAAADALAPGDAIQLALWRDPSLSGEYPVDETGLVVLPLLGTRQVTSVSMPELKQRLLREYTQQLRNQEVRIILLRRVRILGAVKNPGLYRIDPTMTLGDAVALAGGATNEGKLKDIRIHRNGAEVRSSLDSHAQLMEYVRSGDQIVVPNRSWFARNGHVVVAAAISAVAVVLSRAHF
jgi:protein involved in polysaccharide export with SLBB domain